MAKQDPYQNLQAKMATPEAIEALKVCFKAAGYGFFKFYSHRGEVTNMQRGVRIQFSTHYATDILDKFQVILRQKVNATKTDYNNKKDSVVIKDVGKAGALATDAQRRQVVEAVSKIIMIADTFSGDPSIPKPKDCLQTMVLDNVKLRLLAKYSGSDEGEGEEEKDPPEKDDYPHFGVEQFRIVFEARSKKDDQPAVLSIRPPKLMLVPQDEYATWHRARQDEHKMRRKPGWKKSTVDPSDELDSTELFRTADAIRLNLRDGKLTATMVDTGASATSLTRTDNRIIEQLLPTFEDPAFDPEHVYTFAVAMIERLLALQKECAEVHKEINKLRVNIAKLRKTAAEELAETSRELWAT